MRASSLSWRRFYPVGLFVQNLGNNSTTSPGENITNLDGTNTGDGAGREVNLPNHTGGNQVVENGPWSTVLPVADPLSGLMYAEAHSGSNINHVNGSIGEIR